jgi:hypothetical protein
MLDNNSENFDEVLETMPGINSNFEISNIFEWVEREMVKLDLGDKRLNRRTKLTLCLIIKNPTASIPVIMGTWANQQAFYRLCNTEDKRNNKNEEDYYINQKIMKPHLYSTNLRIIEFGPKCQEQQDQIEEYKLSQPQDLALVSSESEKQLEQKQQNFVPRLNLLRLPMSAIKLSIQDTTEQDSNNRKIEGIGPLNYERRLGFFLHVNIIVTPDRITLGIAEAYTWAREPKDKDGNRPGVLESLRWIEVYNNTAELAEQHPNQRFLNIADRESDFQDFIINAHKLNYPVDYLIRATHNRVIDNDKKLWDVVLSTEYKGEIEFIIQPRDKKTGRKLKPRLVKQKLYSKRVMLKCGIETTCIIATEYDCPNDYEPIEWRFQTNLIVEGKEDIEKLINFYQSRWEVEQFFYVLKSCFHVEDMQLKKISRIECALFLKMIAAWYICYLTRLGRYHPDIDAAQFFNPTELRAIYFAAHQEFPDGEIKMGQIMKLVAKIGGFRKTKRNNNPGYKTTWRGLEKVNIVTDLLSYLKNLILKDFKYKDLFKIQKFNMLLFDLFGYNTS